MYILDVIVHYLCVDKSATSEEEITHYVCNDESKLRFLCLAWFIYVGNVFLEKKSLHTPYGFDQHEDNDELQLRFVLYHKMALRGEGNV